MILHHPLSLFFTVQTFAAWAQNAVSLGKICANTLHEIFDSLDVFIGKLSNTLCNPASVHLTKTTNHANASLQILAIKGASKSVKTAK